MQTRPTQLRPHATIGAGRIDTPSERRYDAYCLRLNAALGNLLQPRGVCLSMKEIDMDIVGKALNINVTVTPDGVFGAGGSAKALDTFITVNKGQTFQEDEIDDYCQTWIFWYLFQRIVVGESRRSIMAALMRDTPKQRVERIRAFSRYALTL